MLCGCTSAGLPVLPPPQPSQDAGALAPSLEAHETTLIVPGSPTETYSKLARGILGCWFGTYGPLKQSHIFHAEAESAAKGGDAEIVLQERDIALRDQRGVRAYRIRIVGDPGGARVIATSHKMELQLALAMARDVEAWAKGGSGCQLGALVPPPAVPKDAAAAKVKGRPKR